MIPVLKLRDEAALAPLGGRARKEECKSRIAYACHPFLKELGQSLVKKCASKYCSRTVWLGMSEAKSTKRLLARATELYVL